MARPQKPMPPPIHVPLGRVEANGNLFLSQAWYEYFASVDAMLAGALTNAANDAAAKTAGVPISGLYRNVNAVQIRLA